MDRTTWMAPPRTATLFVGAFLLASLAPGSAEGQTAVRSAQPTQARLEAGGKGVEVLIEGSGLDQVRSAQVELTGRVFQGVTARVLESGRSRLRIEIRAAADVRGTRGLQLVLVSGRELLKTPVELEVAEPPPPPAPRLVSLAISDATVPALGNAVLTVTLDRAAPSGGTNVALASDAAVVSLPAQLLVPAGATVATAPVDAGTPGMDTPVTLRATLAGAQETVALTVLVPLPEPEPEPEPDPADAFEPASASVGTFVATIQGAQAASEPPDPVTVSAGTFVATIAGASPLAEPPEPVTVAVGTLTVTLAPPGGGL